MLQNGFQRLTSSGKFLRFLKKIFFAKFDHLNRCNALRSITSTKDIFLQNAQKKSQRLTASEIFHQPLVSETLIKHENDPNLMKIKSPYSNKFGMYCFLPFHSMTVTFDIKHLIFWILGNAFYGTPGISFKHDRLVFTTGSYRHDQKNKSQEI